MIAFYQLGYGIAAFGVGPLHDSGVGLPTIHAISAVVAAGLGACSFAVAPAAEPRPPSIRGSDTPPSNDGSNHPVGTMSTSALCCLIW